MREYISHAKVSIARGFLPGITLFVLTLFLGTALIRLMQMDTTIPVATDDVEAAARSNERMLQMIQWTLSAVMGLGLALVGVSWFNSTRDRAEVAELKEQVEGMLEATAAREQEIQDTLAAAEQRLRDISAATDRLEIGRLKEELIKEQINQVYPDTLSTPGYCAQVFESEEPGSLRQRAAAELMIEACNRDHPNTVDAHHALERVLPELRLYDPGLAIDALEILNTDLRLAPQVPESERPQY